MNDPVVPRFEPEVIESVASKKWRGDAEKVPTTSVSLLVVDGVSITSRYDKAHEFDCMAAMVQAVDMRLRPFIESIWCDSKANACYSVVLRPCLRADAETIAAQLEQGCFTHERGHNGITLQQANGGDFWLDPHWLNQHPD